VTGEVKVFQNTHRTLSYDNRRRSPSNNFVRLPAGLLGPALIGVHLLSEYGFGFVLSRGNLMVLDRTNVRAVALEAHVHAKKKTAGQILPYRCSACYSRHWMSAEGVRGRGLLHLLWLLIRR
jgi:hypothetical protein